MILALLCLKAISVFHLYFHLVSLSTQEQWWIPLLKMCKTDTKSSIKHPEHPEFEESAQGSCAGNNICPFTAAGWILSWKQESLHSNRCSHEHIKLIHTPENQGVWMFPHRNDVGSLLPVITLIQAVSSNGFVKRVFTSAHKARDLWLAIRHTKWDFSSLWCTEHHASGMSLFL